MAPFLTHLSNPQGGEDLEEDEDDDDEVDDDAPRASSSAVRGLTSAEEGLRLIRESSLEEGDFGKSSEQRPLISRGASTSRSLSRRARKRSMSAHATGDATVTQAILMVRLRERSRTVPRIPGVTVLCHLTDTDLTLAAPFTPTVAQVVHRHRHTVLGQSVSAHDHYVDVVIGSQARF